MKAFVFEEEIAKSKFKELFIAGYKIVHNLHYFRFMTYYTDMYTDNPKEIEKRLDETIAICKTIGIRLKKPWFGKKMTLPFRLYDVEYIMNKIKENNPKKQTPIDKVLSMPMTIEQTSFAIGFVTGLLHIIEGKDMEGNDGHFDDENEYKAISIVYSRYINDIVCPASSVIHKKSNEPLIKLCKENKNIEIETMSNNFYEAIVVVANILPVGKYEKKIVSEREVIDPNKYSIVESDRPGISDIFLALPKGLSSSANLVFCFLIIGGVLGILTKVGLVEAIISKLVRISNIPNLLLIAFLMIFFSIGAGTLGIAGEIILFLPGLVFFAKRLGYNEITGASIGILGVGAGGAGAFLSPFTVGLSQQLAGLPLYSALGFRLIAWSVLTTITILYVVRYARRHRITPEMISENKTFHCKNARLQFILLVAGVAMVAVGTIQLKWGLIELSAAYLAVAVCIAIAGRLTATDTAQAFAEGASRLVPAALVVGFARSIPLILEEANVIDTILHSLAASIQDLPGGARAAGIFVFQLLVSFVIPSGTGQAVLTMPILAPLGDIVGVTRQTVAVAYQFGEAFSDVLSPNVGWFIAALTAVNIPWTKWAKFVLPLFFIWCFIGLAFVLAAYYLHLGPF